MAKVQIKSDILTAYGGIFLVMEKFEQAVNPIINQLLGQCGSSSSYSRGDVSRMLMAVYFCGGTHIEGISNHLLHHSGRHLMLKGCSSGTIPRVVKEQVVANTTYMADNSGMSYDFNTTDRMNGKRGKQPKIIDKRYNDRWGLKLLTCRSNGWGHAKRKQKLEGSIKGWVGYYHLGNMKRFLLEADEWLKCRIRMCIWKSWKKVKTRVENLINCGIKSIRHANGAIPVRFIGAHSQRPNTASGNLQWETMPSRLCHFNGSVPRMASKIGTAVCGTARTVEWKVGKCKSKR